MTKDSYDVVIVGGGAAGLSAALTLSRARRSVLVIDAGDPRNAPASHVHGFLTRDGMPPGELLDAGRAEVRGYGGEIVTGKVVGAEKLLDNGFRVTLADGSTIAARRLVIATGLRDELPDIPGVAERFGRDVLHCPYCHGWEVRDQPIAVLATGPLAIHQALMWGQWTDSVTLLLHTNPEPTDAEYEQLAARGVSVVDGRVEGLQIDDDRLVGVRVAGQVIPCAAVVATPRFTARADILTGLGLEVTEQSMPDGAVIGSYIEADPMGATKIEGVWVAGNVSNLMDQVVSAAAAGVRAGAAVNGDLVLEDIRIAVASQGVLQ